MSDSQSESLTFMAVHAHPDDEVFDVGGTLAYLSAKGVRTVLVMATLGERGDVVDPGLDEATRQNMFVRLDKIWAQELKASAGALNISEVRLLGFRDTGIGDSKGFNDSASFYHATFDVAVKRLVAYIREFKPQVIETHNQRGGYGHPDHIQTHHVVLAAFEAAGDPRLYPELKLETWQPLKLYFSAIPRSYLEHMAAKLGQLSMSSPWDDLTLGTDDQYITTCVDVSNYIKNKLNAFRAHKTQIAPDAYMFTIPEELSRLRSINARSGRMSVAPSCSRDSGLLHRQMARR